ncbi:MAG: acyl-CoA dehydratase activase-related protein [Actinobacteria bacterium]|nr:acyl-CoA dehydratase activase-related protein [Actinomycetota bacterium]
MQRIGIPRGLLYYKYYPMWITFFEELGYQVVVSRPTNKKILDTGIRNSLDEVCLPFKAFTGHVIELVDKVEYLFIPRIRSVEEKKSFTCPRFVAAPDVMLNTLGNHRVPTIISPYISLYTQPMVESYLEVGLELRIKKNRIEEALNLSLLAQEDFCRFKERAISAKNLLDKFQKMDMDFETEKKDEDNSNTVPKIGLIGHPYIIYDSLISMNLISKLISMDFDVITAEMIKEDTAISNYRDIINWMHWTYEKEILGAAATLLKDPNVFGLIYIASFGCGPAALIGDAIIRAAKEHRDKITLHLIIDEHTGEAGIITRLEAFADMIRRRKVKIS